MHKVSITCFSTDQHSVESWPQIIKLAQHCHQTCHFNTASQSNFTCQWVKQAEKWHDQHSHCFVTSGECNFEITSVLHLNTNTLDWCATTTKWHLSSAYAQIWWAVWPTDQRTDHSNHQKTSCYYSTRPEQSE